IIIGTRGSELALWQANFTKMELAKNGIDAELKIIKTKGDATQQWNLSFDKIEGKGFFTKELEDALLADEIDLAVHSCKDLPTEFPAGLTIAAYSHRANPFDILLIRKESKDETKVLKLKENATVGTSSARRKAQLLALRPDINLQDLRGNVPTRVKKLTDENYDAIVLASAGLERLKIDLSAFEIVELKAPMFIPAPAQGVLAFQIREDDTELTKICKILNDEKSAQVTKIERQILHDFEGGCQMPLGVYAEKIEDDFHVWISQASAWNAIPKRIHAVIPNRQMEKRDFVAANLVSKLKNTKPASVFITSDLTENDYLVRVLKSHNYTVNYESFIEFKKTDFDYPQDADWLFFSSKNGVKYFFNSENINPNPDIKIAAINQGTAQAIYEIGYNVDFIGKGSDLKKIAVDFDYVASGKILFPQAKKSMQSIQKGLEKNHNIETVIVYENYPKESIHKRDEEILIFTSPMSVESYFSKFHSKENQQIISIGKTTTKKLQDFNVKDIKTAFEPSNWSVLDEVF
ncbi:MAG TPA: hydroxymethylbilane synthase, partial [Chitinophagales bacterium]|nr:hydroxymethylbilane synthase [Chitinophagales bacterium]